MQPLSNLLNSESSLVGELYQRHWLTLFTSIHQRVASQEDAEDILLDVFLAALENPSLLQMSAQLQEAWLRRVAYNKCMDFHRREKRRAVVPLEQYAGALHDDDAFSEPERTALRQEELTQLRQQLTTLSSIQQEILRLRFAEELPYVQIAARMQKSESAIRGLLFRTLTLLRQIYHKKGGGQ